MNNQPNIIGQIVQFFTFNDEVTGEIIDTVLNKSTTQYVCRCVKTYKNYVIYPRQITTFIKPELPQTHMDNEYETIVSCIQETTYHTYTANDIELEIINKAIEINPEIRPEIIRLFWFRLRDIHGGYDKIINEKSNYKYDDYLFVLTGVMYGEFVDNLLTIARELDIDLTEEDKASLIKRMNRIDDKTNVK